MNTFFTPEQMVQKKISDGAEARIVHGESMSVALWEFAADEQLPEHSHPHEQLTYVVDGEIELIVGDETRLMTAGMSAVIPGGVVHSARTKTSCRIVDAFHPVREDLR